MLLVTAAAAVWLAVWQLDRSVAHVEQRLDSLRALAHEFRYDHPHRFAVIKWRPRWYGEHRWRVHLPEPHRYRLCLALREVTGNPSDQRLPAAAVEARLEPGEHEIEYREVAMDDDAWRLQVFVDGEPMIEHPETADWSAERGSSMSSKGTDGTEEQAIDQPLVLMRKQNHRGQGSWNSNQPSSGVLVWIELAEGR